MLTAADRFIAQADAKTRKRGHGYHARGDVLNLTCAEPDRRFTALVRGGENHAVTLEFAGAEWTSLCPCHAPDHCRHAVAAMLDLRRHATAAVKASATAAPAKTVTAPVKKPARAAQQPPRSPLYDRLVAKLGRALSAAEGEFIRRVQTLYSNASVRQVMESDLAAFSGVFGAANYWQIVELWPDFSQE